MKKNFFALFSVILIVAIVGVYYTFFIKSGDLNKIDSFEECIAAGYPTMESYPAQCQTKDGTSFTENIGNEMQMQDKIKISSPRPNQYLVNPVKIAGQARGSWFFEANAPVKLVDESGAVIAQGYITVQGNPSDSDGAGWMTTEFVPFEGELTFLNPPTPKATLILEKSNPSGMKEEAEQLTIPVYLK